MLGTSVHENVVYTWYVACLFPWFRAGEVDNPHVFLMPHVEGGTSYDVSGDPSLVDVVRNCWSRYA